MKYIDLKKQIKSLNGEVVKNPSGEDYCLGEALANLVLGDKNKNFDHWKAYMLSKKFYEQKHIEMDDPDFEKLKALIQNSDEMVLICGQILEYLHEVANKKSEQLKAVE